MSTNSWSWNILVLLSVPLIFVNDSNSFWYILVVYAPLGLVAGNVLFEDATWFGGPLKGRPWGLLVPMAAAVAWYATDQSLSIARGWGLTALLAVSIKLGARRLMGTAHSERSEQT